MIIASIVGGLGNQLFQYAMARRLAVHHGTELLLDSTGYNKPTDPKASGAGHRRLLLNNFRIAAREATDTEKSALRDRYVSRKSLHRGVRLLRRLSPGFLWPRTHVVEKTYRFDSNALALPNNVYLSGFWQSEKYFRDIEPIIREELRLKDEAIVGSATTRIALLKKRYEAVVSVHVRRGDLVRASDAGDSRVVHGLPMGASYFEEAMAAFSPSSCFLVFSDTSTDVEWCRANLHAANMEFSDASSELWDFEAMRNCDHHVTSNSTFSWWAAWLNQKRGRQVIVPRYWAGSGMVGGMPTDDLIPPDWRIIE